MYQVAAVAYNSALQIYYCRPFPSPAQGGDGHWKVEKVFDGEALVSEYQQILSERGMKGLAADNESSVDHQCCQHTIRQLEEENRQVQ